MNSTLTDSWSEAGWNKVFNLFGEDEFNVRVWGTFIVTSAFYWAFGSFFTIVDLTGWPKFMLKYKVQDDIKSSRISKGQLFDLIKVVGLNQLISFPLFPLLFYFSKSQGYVFDEKFPDILAIFKHLVAFGLITEILFYYSHRLLHHPYFYKRIHKKHHTWISPVAISAAYCHPVEHIVSNVLPIALGPMIMRSHTILWWIWGCLATMETLTVHSGYHLPFLKSPEFHDYHHLKFNYNYGVLGLLDYLHGTDSNYRKSKQFIRDKRLWSTTPVKVLIP